MFLKRFFNLIPRDEYSKALDLLNEGHYVKALRVFDSLLANREKHENLDFPTVELFACESRVALSRERMNAGDLSGAIAEMEKAVYLKPNFADLRYNIGELYVRSERFGDAGDNFRHALTINPKFFKAAIYLARTSVVEGNTEEATTALDQARKCCPGFYKEILSDLVQMLRIRQDDDAVQRTFHEILEDRPSSAQISREVAVEAIQNGNNIEAIRELKKSISLKPDYPDLHNYLGIAYGNSGMTDDAIEEFEVALKINPYYLKARLNLALALYDCGRFLEAQNHIERVLSIQPENQLAKNVLSELQMVMNKR